MVGEEEYGIVHIILLKVVMTEKEKEVQKALGLLKTYCGYVKTQGNTHYEVYEVQDVTMQGARKQLNRIIKAARHLNSNISRKLIFIIDEAEKPNGSWPHSNPKS